MLNWGADCKHKAELFLKQTVQSWNRHKNQKNNIKSLIYFNFLLLPDKSQSDLESRLKTKATPDYRAHCALISEPDHLHPSNMDVPSQPTNRRFKLVLTAIAALVIVNLGGVGAENEQHLFYKEYERLQKQVKPVNYNWQDQIANNQQSTHRRTPNYQHPQFNANFPRSTHGVQQQEQRQEQHLHHPQPRILKIENTKYSVWSQNLTYMSSTDYNALGMAQLYNLTNKVIDLFVDSEEPIPPGESMRRK